MTRDQIKEKMNQFMGYVLQEKEMQEKLLKLKLMANDREILKGRIAEQDNLLNEIETLRKEKMLPMIEEIAQFISIKQKEITEDTSITGKDLDDAIASTLKEFSSDNSVQDFVKQFNATE